MKSGICDDFYMGGNTFCGTYSLTGDTIKAMFIYRPSFMSSTWMPTIMWFKIIDSNNIKKIAYKKYFCTDSLKAKLTFLDNKENATKYFNPIFFTRL